MPFQWASSDTRSGWAALYRFISPTIVQCRGLPNQNQKESWKEEGVLVGGEENNNNSNNNNDDKPRSP